MATKNHKHVKNDHKDEALRGKGVKEFGAKIKNSPELKTWWRAFT